MKLSSPQFWETALPLPLGYGLSRNPQRLGQGGISLEMRARGVQEHAARVSMLDVPVNRRLKLASELKGYAIGMGTLGERMKALRLSRGLTLDEMARVMEITPQALSQIENGVTKNVRLDNFLRFCAHFDADPYFVVFGQSKAAATGRFRKLKDPESGSK